MGQKRDFKSYAVWSICYKSKTEEDYSNMEEKLRTEQPQITLNRYYGTDWWSIKRKKGINKERFMIFNILF